MSDDDAKVANLGLFTGDRVPQFDDDSLRQRVADDHAAQGPRSRALDEVSKTGRWEWHAPKGMPDLMKAIAMSRGGIQTETGVEFDPKEVVCDFCSAPNPDPAWGHESADFNLDTVLPGLEGMGLPGYGSKGAFAACAVCHALILAGDRWGLYRRSVAAYREKYGPWIIPGEESRVGSYGVRGKDLVEQFVWQVQDAFWANRTGDYGSAKKRSWDTGSEPVQSVGVGGGGGRGDEANPSMEEASVQAHTETSPEISQEDSDD